MSTAGGLAYLFVKWQATKKAIGSTMHMSTMSTALGCTLRLMWRSYNHKKYHTILQNFCTRLANTCSLNKQSLNETTMHHLLLKSAYNTLKLKKRNISVQNMQTCSYFGISLPIKFCFATLSQLAHSQSPLLAAVLTAGGPQRWVALFGSRDAAAITKQLPYYFTKLLY